jgi:succinoglycan biosynthesis protein ExoM
MLLAMGSGKHAVLESRGSGGALMVFISILIPTFRRPELLAQVLAACIDQSVSLSSHVEIVVADNSPEAGARDAVTELSRKTPCLRYVHEPRTGLASVRNAALRAARGRFVIFLDDDQLPQPGWLMAFVNAAERGAKAAFGPLAPLYEEPSASRSNVLERMFSRTLPVDDGADIGGFYPYLGTGNSLFELESCFPDRDAFVARFDHAGGEDVWMLKGLRARNIPFTWAAGAKVLEFVPVSRTSADYVRRRRYRSGQIRALLSTHPARRRSAGLIFWMCAGAAQASLYFSLCGLLWFLLPRFAQECRIKASGGMGKVFWFRKPAAAS